MGNILNSKYEKYLVYPNESIDKLTVNRTFERLFEDIDARTSNRQLKLDDATENSYGKAKFSSNDSYFFEPPEDVDKKKEYDESMLTIGQMKDMSDHLSDGDCDMVYAAPLSSSGGDTLPIDKNVYWVRSKYMDSKFLYMPNGINMVSCTFELGFNGLTNALSADGIATHDIVSPVILSSYSNQIDVDAESQHNVTDYLNDEYSRREGLTDVQNILNMDGRRMDIPFITDAKVVLHHNDCTFGKYSAYRQSYLEMCMSIRVGLKSLYETKYGCRTYELLDEDSTVTAVSGVNDMMDRKYRLFTQTPMVMAQIGFYNNESVPKPLFGFDNTLNSSSQPITSEFPVHNRLSQKPLDETVVDGAPLSPVNGSVFVKRVENEYDQDGNIIDNILYLDIVMKFMAGSAADPELEYAVNSFNSRSKVQFVMIGV